MPYTLNRVWWGRGNGQDMDPSGEGGTIILLKGYSNKLPPKYLSLYSMKGPFISQPS